MKGKIIGYNALGESGKQEVTIALEGEYTIIKLGSKVSIVEDFTDND